MPRSEVLTKVVRDFNIESISSASDALMLDFLRYGDGKAFLRNLDNFQRKIRPCYTFRSQRSLLRFAKRYKIANRSDAYDSPQEFAEYVWSHERAHLELLESYGISGNICVAVLGDGEFKPFLFVNVAQFRKVAKRNSRLIMQIFGECLLAPEEVGLGYESETNWGQKFVERAEHMIVRN